MPAWPIDSAMDESNAHAPATQEIGWSFDQN